VLVRPTDPSIITIFVTLRTSGSGVTLVRRIVTSLEINMSTLPTVCFHFRFCRLSFVFCLLCTALPLFCASVDNTLSQAEVIFEAAFQGKCNVLTSLFVVSSSPFVNYN
jgi:hypothetical protein